MATNRREETQDFAAVPIHKEVGTNPTQQYLKKRKTKMSKAPMVTEAEMVSYALTLATAVIDYFDPDQEMTETQGAVLAVAAAKKAASDWNPGKQGFDVYFRMTLQNSIVKALESGNTRTYPDACLDLLDAANGRTN